MYTHMHTCTHQWPSLARWNPASWAFIVDYWFYQKKKRKWIRLASDFAIHHIKYPHIWVNWWLQFQTNSEWNHLIALISLDVMPNLWARVRECMRLKMLISKDQTKRIDIQHGYSNHRDVYRRWLVLFLFFPDHYLIFENWVFLSAFSSSLISDLAHLPSMLVGIQIACAVLSGNTCMHCTHRKWFITENLTHQLCMCANVTSAHFEYIGSIR